MTYDDLLGRPWALPCNPPQSYDCWALAVEVRKRMGLETHTYRVPDQSRTAAHRMAMRSPDPAKWQKLDTPQDGCLVGFGKRFVSHCGVYIDGMVIHSNLLPKVGGIVSSHPLAVAEAHMGEASFWEMT